MFKNVRIAILIWLAALGVAANRLAVAGIDCSIDRNSPIVIPAHAKVDARKQAYRLPDGSILFLGSFTIDADGAPNAYGPDNRGLDDIANAGSPGNWYGLATDAQDCGPTGTPLHQSTNDPAPGFYVSTTSMTNPAVQDCRKQRNYVDSTSIPYVALPKAIAKLDKNRGNLVVIERLSGGSPEFAVLADGAPSYGFGEGSIELATRLGLNSDPRRGGTSQREIVFLEFTDRMGFPASADEVRSNSSAAFAKWGGEARLKVCRQVLSPPPR